MIRFLLAVGAVAGAILLNSCCCMTGEPGPPKLRPLPGFAPVPPAPEVIYQK